MKLSMSMVERWLVDAGYQTVSMVTSDKRELTAARLFESDFTLDEHCLYVSTGEEFGTDAVLIINRDNVINVNSSDGNAVFNEVLNAFDFYNGIEMQLHAAVFSNQPEQAAIGICEWALGPTFLLTSDFRLLGVSHQYDDPDDVTWFWKDMVEHGEMPIELVTQLARSATTDMMSEDPGFQSFDEPYARPYEYGIMHTCRDAQGKPVGYLVVADREPFTPFKRHIAHILADAIDEINAHAESRRYPDASMTADNLLAQLGEERSSQRAAAYLRSYYHIPSTARFFVAASGPRDARLLPRFNRELDAIFDSAVVVHDAERVTMLGWLMDGESMDGAMRRLEGFAERVACPFGVSGTFTDLRSYTFYRGQALAAIPASTGSSVGTFGQIALEFLANADDADIRWHARHPAVFAWEAADDPNVIAMVDTLRAYLLADRGVNKVAQALHVHKNTVLYRVHQLQEMAPFDLDDDREREYLLLSLLIRPR